MKIREQNLEHKKSKNENPGALSVPKYLSCIQSGSTVRRVMQGASLEEEKSLHSSGSLRVVRSHAALRLKSYHGVSPRLALVKGHGSAEFTFGNLRLSRLKA